MHAENEGLSPDFFARQLKIMADVDIQEQMDEKFQLFAGLVSMMKMLQPEGYHQTVPAVIFQPVKE